MTSISQHEYNSLLKAVNNNTLLNRHLQQICSAHGLARGGVKADLQKRVTSLIQQAMTSNNVALFKDLQREIHQGNRPSPSAVPPRPPNYPIQQPPAMPPYESYRPPPYNGGPNALVFKHSPFYEVRSRIGDVRPCEAMNQHRNTVTITIRALEHPDMLDLVCQDNKSYRVMVFCAGDTNGPQDIAFPHQAELKVNSEDVRANLRGLKNKAGSTRPVDITNYLRLRTHGYSNIVTFTYALTTKKFYLVAQICKVIKVEELVTRIRSGPKIRKNQVISEMKSKANDADIEATSSVLSLKCPLSYMRLSLPCRGIGCTHLQCFDATSYLQLQEQGPQWVCPVCNKQARFEQLAVDEYVQDILSNTPVDLEQVTIEPDGQWRVQGPKKLARDKTPSSFNVIDDVEISEVKPRFNEPTPARSIPSVGTPSMVASRESTALPRGLGSTSVKRPPPTVIDLTLDSDEEVEVQRPAKRQQLESFHNNYESYF